MRRRLMHRGSRGPVDAQSGLMMLISKLLDTSLKRRDVFAAPHPGSDSTVELVDLTLEPVFAVDELGSRQPAVQTEPSSNEPHHAPDCRCGGKAGRHRFGYRRGSGMTGHSNERTTPPSEAKPASNAARTSAYESRSPLMFPSAEARAAS